MHLSYDYFNTGNNKYIPVLKHHMPLIIKPDISTDQQKRTDIYIDPSGRVYGSHHTLKMMIKEQIFPQKLNNKYNMIGVKKKWSTVSCKRTRL